MTEAFSKILDLILAWWHALRFWEVLDVEELGFVRRFGKPVRDLRPGLNFKWPVIERAHCENAQQGVYLLDPQSLRTADGKDLVLRASVTFCVSDVRKFYLEAWGALGNIRDLVAGEIGEAVRNLPVAAAYDGAALREALKHSRRYAKAWGITIVRLRLVDCTAARSVRLWQTQTSAAGET